MPELPIFTVDAFTSEVFSGNPAAVCPLETWLPDGTLQAIAAENNLSETAFLVARDDGYDLRWFTPAVEVDLCGHATLASAHVVTTHLAPGTDSVRFHTRSGILTVARDGDAFRMDFPAAPPKHRPDDADVAAGLRATPVETLHAVKLVAVFASEAEVAALRPDMPAVAALDGDGVIATAPGKDIAVIDFVSRYFAPHAGIPEDPVTGSAHCVLAPYWADRLGKTRLNARQISRRGGDLAVEVHGDRVLLTGRVAPYLEGRIRF